MAESQKIHLYDAPDDYSPSSLIYKFPDDVQHINEFVDKNPVFSYRYVSISKSDFCFNNPKISHKPYREYFKVLKKISNETIKNLLDVPDKELHFHTIELRKSPELREKIADLVTGNRNQNLDDNNFPIVGQFALYTSPLVRNGETGKLEIRGESPRIIFFFGNHGVFHLLIFDLNHQIYPDKKS